MIDISGMIGGLKKKEGKRERQREGGRGREREKKERKSLVQSIFKFTKVK